MGDDKLLLTPLGKTKAGEENTQKVEMGKGTWRATGHGQCNRDLTRGLWEGQTDEIWRCGSIHRWVGGCVLC